MFNSEISEETIDEVKTLVVNSGGIIYQEFPLIKGFAVRMTEPLVLVLTESYSSILNLEEDKPG